MPDSEPVAWRSVVYGTPVISSDGHSRLAFGRLRWGVLVARRAWLQPSDVLNTLPLDQLRASLRRNTDRAGGAG